MAIAGGFSTIDDELVQVIGTKKTRVIRWIYTQASGIDQSVSMADATTAARLNQFGIGNVESVRVVRGPYNAVTNLLPSYDVWFDVSGGMPGTMYVSAAPNSNVIVVDILLTGTG